MRPSPHPLWLALAALGACDTDSPGGETFMTHWPPASYAQDLSHGVVGQGGEQVEILPWDRDVSVKQPDAGDENDAGGLDVSASDKKQYSQKTQD